MADRDAGEAGDETGHGSRRRAHAGESVCRAVQPAAEGERPFAMGGGAVKRDEVGQPGDLVDEPGVELAAGRDGRRRRAS